MNPLAPHLDPRAVYHGSDGDATKALYAELERRGAAGRVVVNLFRACKNSSRAKKYRGGIRGQGSYRSMAYERKAWAMSQLCEILAKEAESLGMRWGWKIDPAQEYHRWVLYVDTPQGQCSFHTDRRGVGPEYAGDWDGARDVAHERIIAYAEQVLAIPAQGD